ncbi:hypothetical protein WG901_16355 [Novosphingobium sp. PS1R-30]|uniref:Uncharacterized protein n=1 Tax=Novosphingobium anseongense TaxID=3133436 RepID=A0ABU8RYT1_9SPHN
MQFNTLSTKLRRGERCWPAEFALRLAGITALGACLALARLLIRQVEQPATPADFALGLCLVACLWAGLAFVVAGPELFHVLPRPFP